MIVFILIPPADEVACFHGGGGMPVEGGGLRVDVSASGREDGIPPARMGYYGIRSTKGVVGILLECILVCKYFYDKGNGY